MKIKKEREKKIALHIASGRMKKMIVVSAKMRFSFGTVHRLVFRVRHEVNV